MPIFKNLYDYNRFLRTMIYYQIDSVKPKFSIFSPETTILDLSKRTVEIISYCLMPNHFHFLLKPAKEGGLSEFVSKLSNSYTKYVNVKNGRVGPLLQGEFKAVRVESNEQLLHLTRYIHLNPLIGFATKNLETYKWSSYPEYVSLIDNSICEKDIIINQFKNRDLYKQFVLNHVEYAKKLDQIKHLLLDLDE